MGRAREVELDLVRRSLVEADELAAEAEAHVAAARGDEADEGCEADGPSDEVAPALF